MSDGVLAVDLGGTRMRAAVVSAQGEVMRRHQDATAAGPPERLLELARHVARDSDVVEAVVGVPGRVDYEKGRLEHAPNLPSGWLAMLDERHLSNMLGLPATLANDADLAAVGEAYFGAGRPYRDVVYVTVSTGVGAGVLLRRQLVRGRRSLAEVGHTVIDLRAMAAKEPATLEELGSGTAMAALATASGLDARGAALQARVETGDPVAVRVWAAAVEATAVGVTNLAFLFTPEAIVLGGGVSLSGELLLGPVREHLRAHGPLGLRDEIELRAASLGDDAGLVGAAAWLRATVPR